MTDNLVRIMILMMALVIGLVSAYALGLLSRLKAGDSRSFENIFAVLGCKSTEEKKDTLYKSAHLIWIVYLPYFLLALNYFANQVLPFILTLLLLLVVGINFIIGIVRIQLARELKEAVATTRTSRLGILTNMIIMAVHIGYLL